MTQLLKNTFSYHRYRLHTLYSPHNKSFLRTPWDVPSGTCHAPLYSYTGSTRWRCCTHIFFGQLVPELQCYPLQLCGLKHLLMANSAVPFWCWWKSLRPSLVLEVCLGWFLSGLWWNKDYSIKLRLLRTGSLTRSFLQLWLEQLIGCTALYRSVYYCDVTLASIWYMLQANINLNST